MANILIQEDWVNRSGGYGCGDSGIYECAYDNIGDLFRALQSFYGRCESKVYVGDGVAVGWVFVKAEKYRDSEETYIQETWVTLQTELPTVVRTPHYLEIGRAA